jgi:hypothetical protein
VRFAEGHGSNQVFFFCCCCCCSNGDLYFTPHDNDSYSSYTTRLLLVCTSIRNTRIGNSPCSLRHTDIHQQSHLSFFRLFSCFTILDIKSVDNEIFDSGVKRGGHGCSPITVFGKGREEGVGELFSSLFVECMCLSFLVLCAEVKHCRPLRPQRAVLFTRQ